MTFRVGQKVICVDDGPDPRCPSRDWKNGDKPTLGWIYTVIGHDEPFLDRPCIFINGYEHWSFLARRFRPLVKHKTDISELKALLIPGAKIREDA